MINLNTSCSEGTLLSAAEIAVLKLQTCVQVCFNKCSCMRVCFKVDKEKKRMELLKNRPFWIPRYRHMISIGNKLGCILP